MQNRAKKLAALVELFLSKGFVAARALRLAVPDTGWFFVRPKLSNSLRV